MHANWLPLTTVQVNDALLQQSFIKHDSQAENAERQWDEEIAKQYVQATQLAQEILESKK
jgi:hypothetical protein